MRDFFFKLLIPMKITFVRRHLVINFCYFWKTRWFSFLLKEQNFFFILEKKPSKCFEKTLSKSSYINEVFRIWCGHFLSSSGLIFWSLFFRGVHSRPDGALLYTIISEFPWKKCRRHAMLGGRKKGPSCSFWNMQEDIIWWVVPKKIH